MSPGIEFPPRDSFSSSESLPSGGFGEGRLPLILISPGTLEMDTLVIDNHGFVRGAGDLDRRDRIGLDVDTAAS